MDNIRNAATEQHTDNLTHSSLLAEFQDSSAAKILRVATQGGHAAIHNAIQSPVSGVTELIDKTFNSNVSTYTKFIAEPTRAETAAERGAQQIGSLAGMVAPLLLLHKGVRMAGNKYLGATSALDRSGAMQRLVGESAVTGALFEGFFQQNEKADSANFYTQRFNNALTGASTFAVLTGSALALKGISPHLEKYKALGPLGTIVGSDVGSMTLAGLPAGFAHAELKSLLKDGSLASRNDVALSMGSFALLGGAFAGAGRMLGKPSSALPEFEKGPARAPEPLRQNAPERPMTFQDVHDLDIYTNRPDTRAERGLMEYSEALNSKGNSKGTNSPEVKAIRERYATEPGFLELTEEVDRLHRLFGRKSPAPPESSFTEPPADPRLGEALSKYAELMADHGPRSREATAFFNRHRAIPEFTDLAGECQRLELLAGKHPRGLFPDGLRSLMPSRDSAPILAAAAGRKLFGR